MSRHGARRDGRPRRARRARRRRSRRASTDWSSTRSARRAGSCGREASGRWSPNDAIPIRPLASRRWTPRGSRASTRCGSRPRRGSGRRRGRARRSAVRRAVVLPRVVPLARAAAARLEGRRARLRSQPKGTELYHGHDFQLPAGGARRHSARTSISSSTRSTPMTCSTSPTHTRLAFGRLLRTHFAELYHRGADIELLRAHGKKIVYSNNGCLDGVAQTSFAELGRRRQRARSARSATSPSGLQRRAQPRVGRVPQPHGRPPGDHRRQPRGLQQRRARPRDPRVLLPRSGALAPGPLVPDELPRPDP